MNSDNLEKDELTVYLSKEEIEMIGALAPENRAKATAALLAQKIIRAKIDAHLDEILRLKDAMVKLGVK